MMIHKALRLLVATALVGSLYGCTTMTGESAGRNVSDTSITASVKSKLATERASTLTSVDVDTVKGTVYLTGIVPDAATSRRAEQLASSVSGVNHVVNNL